MTEGTVQDMIEYEQEGSYMEDGGMHEEEEEEEEDEEGEEEESEDEVESLASVPFQDLSRAQMMRRLKTQQKKINEARANIVRPDKKVSAAAVRSAMEGVDLIKVPDVGQPRKVSLYSTKHKPLLYPKRVASPHPQPKPRLYSEKDVEELLLNQSKIKDPPAPVRKMPPIFTETEVQHKIKDKKAQPKKSSPEKTKSKPILYTEEEVQFMLLTKKPEPSIQDIVNKKNTPPLMYTEQQVEEMLLQKKAAPPTETPKPVLYTEQEVMAFLKDKEALQEESTKPETIRPHTPMFTETEVKDMEFHAPEERDKFSSSTPKKPSPIHDTSQLPTPGPVRKRPRSPTPPISPVITEVFDSPVFKRTKKSPAPESPVLKQSTPTPAPDFSMFDAVQVKLGEFSDQLATRHHEAMDSMWRSTKKLLEKQAEVEMGITAATKRMGERYEAYELKVEQVSKTYLGKHEESMQAIAVVDEKIVDHILKRNMHFMKSMDSFISSVTVNSRSVCEAQTTLCTGVIQVSENLTSMTKYVSALGRNHQKLQAVMEKADKVVETLVSNMETLSLGQQRIIENMKPNLAPNPAQHIPMPSGSGMSAQNFTAQQDNRQDEEQVARQTEVQVEGNMQTELVTELPNDPSTSAYLTHQEPPEGMYLY